MKLTQIITIGIISLAISLSYCMQNKENKTTESLDKTEHKIAVKKTFLKGFVGVKQDKETLELRPEIGWAITDTGKQGIKDDDANYKD